MEEVVLMVIVGLVVRYLTRLESKIHIEGLTSQVRHLEGTVEWYKQYVDSIENAENIDISSHTMD